MKSESHAEADSDVTPKVGQRLRDMRKMRGISVREQARLLGVSPSTLSITICFPPRQTLHVRPSSSALPPKVKSS